MLICRYSSSFYALMAMFRPMVHRYRVTHHLYPLSLCSFILVPFAAMVYLRFLSDLPFIGHNIPSKRKEQIDVAWSDFIYDMEFPFGSISKGIFCELKPSTRPLQYLKRQQHYKAGHRCFNILYKRYQSTSKEAIRHTHTCPIIKSQHKS